MTRPTENRFIGSEPDERAAVALAARALRNLARFHGSASASRMHDTHGLLEWAAVPAAVEINASYRRLLDQAAGGEAESDAAYWANLLLIEDIVLDAACDRSPVLSGELAAAAQMIRIMREEAEFALEHTGYPSAAAGAHERQAEPAGFAPAAGAGTGDRAPVPAAGAPARGVDLHGLPGSVVEAVIGEAARLQPAPLLSRRAALRMWSSAAVLDRGEPRPEALVGLAALALVALAEDAGAGAGVRAPGSPF